MDFSGLFILLAMSNNDMSWANKLKSLSGSNPSIFPTIIFDISCYKSKRQCLIWNQDYYPV